MSARPRVLLTRRWPVEVEAALGARYRLSVNVDDVPLTPAQLSRALATMDAVCPTVTDRLDEAVLNLAQPQARLIANYGVGVNHIDLAAAERRGFVVTNTPGVLTDCTADLALSLLLMVARRTGEGEREVRAGQWQGWRPTHLLGSRVSGKTLGLVGFGRIAQAVARRASAGFGMRVLFHAPRRPPAGVAEALGAEPCASLEALLVQSDFVSLHCPGGTATRHLLDAARLAVMKPTAFLINTARGDVVDQHALIDALRAGRIAGAGLDVYDGEPAVPAALIDLPNVVLLPHLGSATQETRIAMGLKVMENLDAWFAGHTPPDRVI